MNACGEQIQRRAAINPAEGIREYGEVLFADPVNNRYPIDTEKHIRAAWSYIHHEHDASMYSVDDVSCIESRIQEAAAAEGITLMG